MILRRATRDSSVVRACERLAPRLTRSLCTPYRTYESGLKFRDLHTPAEGRAADDGDLLSVHHTGRLEDGTVFDTSLNGSMSGNQIEFEGVSAEQLKGWDRGTPVQFTLGGGEVLPGWEEGLHGMRVGGKRELVVPPELGYGEQGAGEAIPPNSVLRFEVELLDIRDAPPPSMFQRLNRLFRPPGHQLR